MSKFGAPPKIIPEFTGLQVNTAVQALPIPIIYGSPRVSINLIYYNDFNVQQVSTGGGKGILSGGKGNKQVEYFATIILAIGEGGRDDANGIGPILVIYQDQAVYTTSNYPSPGLNFLAGTGSQAAWSYVVSKWPSDARTYKNTAYLAVANAELDSSATVPQINLVLSGTLHNTCPLNNSTIVITSGQYDANNKLISTLGPINLGDCDADPASVIFDFLQNARYGAGIPTNLIDYAPGGSLFSGPNATNPSIGDSALQTYCQAVGLGWSVVLNNVETANSILDRWTKNLVVAPVWTGEILKFIPYWDTPTSANPGWDANNPLGIPVKYFTPNTTPLVSITLDHLLQAKNKDEDPITFSRIDPMTVYNFVRVDYRDRSNFYNDNVVEAKDEAAIELFGPRVDNVGIANEFTLADYANVSAQMQLRRYQSIRNTYTFRLGPLWAFLDPMDIIQIPDPTNWGAVLDVRITACDDDEDEITTYTAEEFPLGAASPIFIPTSPTSPPNQGPTNAPASPVFPPVIFEPTTAMLAATGMSSPQVIIGASGGTAAGGFDTNWGGCAIWISLDDVNYELAPTPSVLQGPSAVGQLEAAIPYYGGANPDTIDTLVVSMTESGIVLPSYVDASAAAGKSLCIVKDANTFELLTYTTATLVSGKTFNLTGLYRGLYSTLSAAFSPGAQFLFMGFPTFFEATLPSQYVGKTFWVKLQSFNVFQSGVQDLSACVAYQYVATGPTPAAPALPGFSTPRQRRGMLIGEPLSRQWPRIGHG